MRRGGQAGMVRHHPQPGADRQVERQRRLGLDLAMLLIGAPTMASPGCGWPAGPAPGRSPSRAARPAVLRSFDNASAAGIQQQRVPGGGR